MKTRSACIVLLACTVTLAAGQVKLVNPKPVFQGEPPAYKRPRQYHVFAMRLSPDGKRLLYTRPVAGTENADRRAARFETVLRDLTSGKDTVIPAEPLESGFRTVSSRFNFFDPAAKRLLVVNAKMETVQIDEHTRSGRARVSWRIYDIAKAKAADAGIEEARAIPHFTADGRGLLVSAPDMKARKFVTKVVPLADPSAKARALSAPGWVQSVCPAGDVAVFFAPPKRTRPARPPAPGQPFQRPSARVLLWDLKADKQLAQLPTHPRNSVLDDNETQWTADGRYLYYWDFQDEPGADQAATPRPRLQTVTRIWDRQADKLIATVPDAVPVGPGPGRSTMVLAKRTRDRSGGFLVHDAAAGVDQPVGDASMKLIHATAGKVVYAQQQTGSDQEKVYVADLEMPGGKKQGKGF